MDIRSHAAASTLLLPLCLALSPATRAQDVCSVLEITALSYAPFTDTALQVVVVQNDPGFFFSYPQFMLIDLEGDTVALEQVNFFGIGPGGDPQAHRMDLRPGMALPATPFNGSLVLRYMTGEAPENTCTWPLDQQALCPPPPCDSVLVFVQNFGDADVDAAFTWSITDADGNTVGEGDLTIAAGSVSMDTALVCLPPGELTLHMARPFDTGGQFFFGITPVGFFADGPSAQFVQPGDPGIPMDLAFDFFTPCMEPSNGISRPAAPAPLITLADGLVQVRSANGEALGLLEVMDATGRSVRRVDARSSSTAIALGGQARGMYLLRSLAAHPFPTQRFVIP